MHRISLATLSWFLVIVLFHVQSDPSPVLGQPLTMRPGLQGLANQIAAEMTEGKRHKIAVVAFGDINGEITAFGKYISEELVVQLFMSRKFQVVERNLLNKIVDEHKLNVSGYVDESTARAFGRILGVDAICTGTVVELIDTVRINARLISTETGAIFAVASVELFKDESLKKLMQLGLPDVKTSRLEDRVQQTEEKHQDKGYMDLSLWEVLDGHWEHKNNAFYGSGGHLILREELTDYDVEATVRHISGPTQFAASVGTRVNVIRGGTDRFRGNKSDIQGYVFNFTFNATFNVFNGIGGKWYLIHPDWNTWKTSSALDRNENHIRITALGSHVAIVVNGHLVDEFQDTTHRSGSVTLWSQDPAQIIRFSDIRIVKKHGSDGGQSLK